MALSQSECMELATRMLALESPSRENVRRAEAELQRLCHEGVARACETLAERGVDRVAPRQDAQSRATERDGGDPNEPSGTTQRDQYAAAELVLEDAATTDPRHAAALDAMRSLCAEDFVNACDWIADAQSGGTSLLQTQCDDGHLASCVALVRAYLHGLGTFSDPARAMAVAAAVCESDDSGDTPSGAGATGLYCEDVANSFAAAGLPEEAAELAPTRWSQSGEPIHLALPELGNGGSGEELEPVRGRYERQFMQYCFERQLARGVARGPYHVVLEFSVEPGGSTSDIRFPTVPEYASGPVPARLLDCIEGHVRDWQFAGVEQVVRLRRPYRLEASRH